MKRDAFIPAGLIALLLLAAVSSGRAAGVGTDPNAMGPIPQERAHRDTEISRRIRQSLEENEDLSTHARNIEIATENGRVTLTGPVGSELERQRMASLAAAVDGVTDIDNQLSIAGGSERRKEKRK